MGSFDLAELPASDLVRLFRRGEASPVEATRAALARIERCNVRYNAFCLIDAEHALAAAAASEERWRKSEPRSYIDGVPASIKDIILTRGWPTLRGSKTVDPAQEWNEDAPAVARLREAGSVLLGKTTTPEFGWKAVCDFPLTGITRNPWDDRKTPGGSSGGAAVAAALHMGRLHLGTDGGGSIRIPSAFTGVFGSSRRSAWCRPIRLVRSARSRILARSPRRWTMPRACLPSCAARRARLVQPALSPLRLYHWS